MKLYNIRHPTSEIRACIKNLSALSQENSSPAVPELRTSDKEIRGPLTATSAGWFRGAPLLNSSPGFCERRRQCHITAPYCTCEIGRDTGPRASLIGAAALERNFQMMQLLGVAHGKISTGVAALSPNAPTGISRDTRTAATSAPADHRHRQEAIGGWRWHRGGAATATPVRGRGAALLEVVLEPVVMMVVRRCRAPGHLVVAPFAFAGTFPRDASPLVSVPRLSAANKCDVPGVIAIGGNENRIYELGRCWASRSLSPR